MAETQKQPILKYLDYFFVLRPMLFYPGWSTLLAGYLITYKAYFYLPPEQMLSLDFQKIGLLFLTFAAAMGGSFLLNQLADVQSDLKNNKLFLISQGHIPRRNAVIEVVILFALALVLAWRQGAEIFVSVVLFCVITGYFYNFKPFKLKDRPWWSLWANMAMGFLAFCLGWFAAFPEFSQTLFIDALPYLFFNTALYFYTTLPDMEGDRASGKRTLAVQYGQKTIIVISFILFLFSLAAAFWLKDFLALIIVVPAIPFFLLTLFKQDTSSTIRATKFTILFFAVAVCLKVPFYFLIMVAGFFATRLYFKRRFDFDYPNFKGKG